jgi:FkbH-like protein
LRHIFQQAPFPRDDVQPGDVAWARLANEAEGQAFIDACKAVITRLIDKLAPIDCCLVLLSFIEPKSSYLGPTLGLYSKTSPTVIVRALNEHLYDCAQSRANMHFLDINGVLSAHGSASIQDDGMVHMSHASYLGLGRDAMDDGRLQPPTPIEEIFNARQGRETTLPALGRHIVDTLSVLHHRNNPVKLIIVDLDDTMWRGVAADENQPHWRFSEGWPLGLVEALLVYKRRGGLLAVCSKNDIDVVRDRMAYIYRDALRLDDFASVRINFGRKSDNIREILEEVNILPGHALFIDDNPREIDEVSRAFPEMRVLTRSPYEWRHHILFHPSFQVATVTTESGNRTQTIQAKIERDAQQKGMNQDEWLRSLGIHCQIDVVTDAAHPGYPRLMELVNKTNQFNTTGQRWSPAAMEGLLREGGRIYGVTMRDRLVNNGLVGLSIVHGNRVLQTVLSCRVFGLGVEYCLANAVMGDILRDHGEVRADSSITPRNLSSRSYLGGCGFVESEQGPIAHSAPAIPEWITVQAG